MAECGVAARPGPVAASQPQPLGCLPQSRRRHTPGSDAPVRSPVRALPHGADPQQSGPGTRERVDRKPAWPSEASDRGRAVAARVARFRYARGLSPLRRRDRRAAQCSQQQATGSRAPGATGAAGEPDDGYEETIVTVTSTSGFTLKKVVYSVPSRLIG